MKKEDWLTKLKLYDQIIDRIPEIERKGKTMPYTSANERMFSQLNKKGELGIRLPKEQRECFLEEYQTTLFITYNTVMKEYVLVPDDMLTNTEVLVTYIKMGHEYVSSLPPKKK